MNKVLIADNVSDAVFKVFDKNNIEYTQKIGLTAVSYTHLTLPTKA